jgi:hypothetical protein
METNNIQDLNFSRQFNINDISFENVNKEFENKFRERYNNSLSMMSDNYDKLENASGASSLEALEKIARNIKYYDKNSDFEESFEEIFREEDPLTET